MSKKFWMRIHLYVSMFFIPMALIYAITGGLEIMFTFHGYSHEEVIEISLNEPLSDDLSDLESWVAKQLNERQLPVPHGHGEMQRGQFIWGRPTGINVALRRNRTENTVRIRHEVPDFYNRLANLHEGRGGQAFNIMAMSFSVAMILIYISGILICWKSVKLRRLVLASLSIGLVVTAIAIMMSM